MACVEKFQRHDALDDISTVVETEPDDEVSNSRRKAQMNEDSLKTHIYHQFDFTQYNEESLKLPVYNCKKEVSFLLNTKQ